MPHQHLYYRNGVRISAAEALDHKGLLREGCTLRVPAMFRDSAQSDSHTRITDASGDSSELSFSRPGWRMLADASVNDARETAYQEYLDYITNAWRTRPPRV
jgi:hypothetical protein